MRARPRDRGARRALAAARAAAGGGRLSTLALRAGALARRPAASPQLTTAGAQIAAGAGNLVYALILARLLPSGYGEVAAFLGAYLIVHVPLTSLTALVSVRPGGIVRLRRRVLALGALGGAALLALAPLAPRVGWSPALAVILAAAVPAAGLLAVERGRLLASRQDGRMAATLVIEPAARIGLGLVAAGAAGPAGAALGVVAGGYAALLVALGGAGGVARAREASRAAGPGVVGTFTLLAVVQSQDVVLAGAVLAAGASAQFGVLSTLGGIAAFATTTVPLVLLPRAVAGERGALQAALGVAVALGMAAVLPALVAPELLVRLLFGDHYAGVASLAAPYLVAMALLGVARVLLAHRAALRPTWPLAGLLVGSAALQALLVLAAHTPGDVVRATLLATLLLAVGATALELVPALRAPSRPAARPAPPGAPEAPEAPPAPAPPRGGRLRGDRRLLLGFMAAALVIRLLCGRSLWLDEATSVSQAQMPFGRMLDQLRFTDVHPPLHDAILWVLAHAFGTQALVMRAPSLIAGVALVGVLYLAGRELWDRRAGLAAAGFAVVAPFALWYSQEARMYELFMLWAALAIYGQARVHRRADRAGWAVWGAATLLLLWTHYFALFPVAVQVAAFLVLLARRRRAGEPIGHLVRPALAVAALVALACVPLAVFAHHQYAANEASGRGFTQTPSQTGRAVEAGHHLGPYVVLTNIVWALLGYHGAGVMARLTALWPLGILLGLLLLGRGRDRASWLLWALVLVPLGALYAIGHAKPFLFEVRYFAGAVPALLLLLARGATGWTGGRRWAVGLVCGLAVTSFGVAAADQQLSQTNPRLYDFRGALARVEKIARPGDAVVYQPRYLDDLVTYYAPNLRAQPLDPGRLPQVARGHRIFLLASFQEDPTLAAPTDAALVDLTRHHRLERVIRRPQVEVWVYR